MCNSEFVLIDWRIGILSTEQQARGCANNTLLYVVQEVRIVHYNSP